MARQRRITQPTADHRVRPDRGRVSNQQGEERLLPNSPGHILHLQRTIGNQATVAYLQRQEEGSATVLTGAAADETVSDEASLTSELTKELEQDKTPTDEEFTETLKEKAITSRFRDGTKFNSQHPNLAQLGIRPKEIKGEKTAVYVGNENYKHHPVDGPWGLLPGAERDLEAMKGVMEGQGYKTLSKEKDKGSQEVENTFATAIKQARPGQNLLLYYAGHGLPKGVIGVDSDFKDEAQGAGDEGRGFKLKKPPQGEPGDFPEFTDVAPYSAIVKALEAGVAKGVHSTFISDACHSGAAADLVRDKAVEKLSAVENPAMDAVTKQIKRLEDMKDQIPTGEVTAAQEPAAAESADSRGVKQVTVEEGGEAAKTYWEEVVRPELKTINVYLKEAGIDVAVPHQLTDYSKSAIEQAINAVINGLVDMGELVKKEAEESALEKAPG